MLKRFLFLTNLFLTLNYLSTFLLGDSASIDAALSELSRTLPSNLLKKPEMLQYITQFDKQYDLAKRQPLYSPVQQDEGALIRQKRTVVSRRKTKLLNNEDVESLNIFKFCHLENKAASEEEAYTFAQLAEAAYCGSALNNWTCTGPCQHPSTAGISNVTVSETFGYGLKYFIAINKPKKWLVVSFRGTVINPFTMVMNLFASSVKLIRTNSQANKYIQVHSGFKTMYDSISKEVLALVTKYKKDFPGETVSLKLTGHSLGGVLAEFLSLDVVDKGIYSSSEIQLFTYGAPRVGNKEYVAFVNNLGFKTVTRVTFNNDLVPLLPPQGMGYFHHGKELHLRGLFQDLPKEKQVLVSADTNWSYTKLKELQQGSLKAQLCNDTCAEEDLKCVLAQDADSTLANHLRAWDIVFGPWC